MFIGIYRAKTLRRKEGSKSVCVFARHFHFITTRFVNVFKLKKPDILPGFLSSVNPYTKFFLI
jgi:hypothetical protein